MRVAFAGTPPFAARALEALVAAGHSLELVLTQPDRPAGRGMGVAPTAVAKSAAAHGIPTEKPVSLKDPAAHQRLRELRPDVMVVAAYGLILPDSVLRLPRHGCLNIHASLLPRWRGAAPIQRAILAGDHETGVTIMQMDAGLDTGDMLLKKPCQITAHDNAQTLHDKLSALGAEAIVEALRLLQQGKLIGVPQDDTHSTYAGKLRKGEGLLDWDYPASHLARAVRAYNPVPVAYSTLNQLTVKIWQASVREGMKGPSGTVLSDTVRAGTVLAIEKMGIIVACGQDALRLEILQRPNAKALPAAQFLHGYAIHPGDRFAVR